MKTIYLAGPIAGLTFNQASEWRNTAAAALRDHGWRVLDPMRHNAIYRDHPDIPIGPDHPANREFFATFDPYIADRSDIIEADALLVHMPNDVRLTMRGTLWECGLGDAFNKRLILFPLQERNSPFYVRFEKRAKDLWDAIEHIITQIP